MFQSQFNVRIGLAAAALAVLLTSAACAEEIVVSNYGVSANGMPYAVAMAKGFFKEEGADVTGIITSAGGGTTLRNMLAGNVPYGEVNPNVVVAAVQQGADIKIVSDNVSTVAEFIWAVKPNSPIKSVKDLKGKSIGIVSLSSNSELQVNVMLERAGMSPNDVKFVPTPYPASYEALKSGLIDVGSFPQPFLAMAKHLGNVRTIFTAKDAAPYEEELLLLIAKNEFLTKNRAVVEAMLVDFIAATKYYTEHTKEARKALIDSKMVRIDPEVFYEMEDPYHEPTARLDVDGLQKMQELQVAAGFQKHSADLSRYVDMSYLPK